MDPCSEIRYEMHKIEDKRNSELLDILRESQKPIKIERTNFNIVDLLKSSRLK
jgi:hypothetical protein